MTSALDPGVVPPLGDALAQRREIARADLAAGGSEIICAIRSPAGSDRYDVRTSGGAENGRVTLTHLAQVTGRAPTRVSRRLEALEASRSGIDDYCLNMDE